MLRAALYARISLDRDKTSDSPERQRKWGAQRCQDEGWTLVDTYEDRDRSAFTGATRPEYERLIADVTAGRIDVVVALHQDRLWRSVLDQQAFLVIGRASGLKLVATKSNDFDPADADDEFMSTLVAAMARKESQNTSRRMKDKQASKAAAGEFHGGGRAFGHNTDRTKSVPREAKLIQDAARRMLRGESLRSVVLDWNKRGVKTTKGLAWNVPGLADLLKQPRLAGYREHLGELHEASWPLILDRKTFEQVQGMFRTRATGKTRAPRRNVLSSLVMCGRCGAPLKGSWKTKRNGELERRYVCPAPGTRKEGCGGLSIGADVTEEIVAETVISYLDSERLTKALARLSRDSGDDVGDLMQQLERDRARLAELGNDYADDVIDRVEFRRLSGRVKERIETTEARIAKSVTTPRLDLAGQGLRLRKAWPKLSLPEQFDVLKAVVEKVVIHPAPRPVNVFDPKRVEVVLKYR